MKKDDETRPATMEELNALFDSEHWKELEALADEAQKQMETMNLVPYDAGAERYLIDRYPIRALYARADIQDIAMSQHETALTEEEIREVSDTFFDAYPDEIYIAISDAIERVVNERQQKTK